MFAVGGKQAGGWRPRSLLLHPVAALAALPLPVELDAAVGAAMPLALHYKFGAGADAHVQLSFL
jgi:hypothetical protein